LKRFLVGGLLALAAGGCAGSNSDHDVEGALKEGRVAGVGALRATSAECDSGAAVMVGEREGRLYECNVETRGRTMRLSCGMFDDDDVAYCSELGPEPGEPVFTTAEERAAPKEVTWKCEDVDEQGREIGPAFVSIKDAPPGSPVEEHDWMTQASARRLASRLGAEFGVDC
jgi:hypothetical protein